MPITSAGLHGPGAPRGRRGSGQATTVAFSVPEGSLGWWRDRLLALGVQASEPSTRSGEDALTVRDPDGLVLELAAHREAEPEALIGWS